MRAARALRLVAAAGSLACGGGDAGERRPSPPDGAPEQVVMGTAEGTGPGTGASAVKPKCAHTGKWDPCTVAERLEQSGLAPRSLATPQPDGGLGAPAVAYTLGRAELRIWLFPDRQAQERAAKTLPPGRYLAPGEEVGMEPLPTLIANENLLALLTSRNEHQRERVGDALTAGPPQPRP